MESLERYGHGGDRWTAGERFGREAGSFLDFSANINPLGPPTGVLDILRRIWNDPECSTLSRYPDPAARSLRSALAGRLGVDPEQVLIGNGGAELIDLLHSAARPRRVGVIHPSFAEYEAAARKRGQEIVPLKTEWDRAFLPERKALLAWIREVDLAWVGHPNNPTGTRIPFEDLVAAAEEATRRGTVLAVDEAFLDFLPPGEEISLLPRLEEFPTTILFRSMTKFYAIPGLRLGYAVAAPEWIRKLAEWQIPWSVNGVAQEAGTAALGDREFEEQTRSWLAEERPALARGLASLPGVDVLPGEANYLLLRVAENVGGPIPSRWLQRELGERGIMIRDGSTYPGLDGRYVRVAVRGRKENRRLLSAMEDALFRAGRVGS
ncbi:L-threonine O-3-phosphate decarboxylase [Melghirimyces profundicolus]|uniref:threonine-phosphate decarboxylase n=1 Tax=Melghirimyces profundicolus TaxID=1242148 RepID=A0A2T6C7K3_9BACL|nr:threonine-phosphate decarboxylase CobD [Melghirimyces profundicolus]PTX64304.1 L-threonine O-3-phosphate decarboxylase [Melghirimyces profundicolus]